MFRKYKSSRPKVFCKSDVFKGFTNFTRKDLCGSLVLKKQQVTGRLKRDPDTGVFL